MIDEIRNRRSPKSRIKVTYPNGDSICYQHAKDTVLEVLRRIDPSKYGEIKLETRGERLITDCVSKENEEYKLPICEGWWYIKKGANTDTMVYQLIEINRVLDLGIEIEHGSGLKVTDTVENPVPSKRPKSKVRVTFNDGTILDDERFLVVYRDFIEKIGVERIGAVDATNEIIWRDEPLIRTTNVNNNRAKLGEYKWFLEPRNTNEAVKMISLIASKCRIDCKIEKY